MMIEELMAEGMEARAARHANMKLAEIAAEYKAIKEALEEAGEVKTALQKISDSYSKHILPTRMEEEGIETVRIEGIGRLQTKSDIYCSCPAPNREALQDWLVDHGHGSLIHFQYSLQDAVAVSIVKGPKFMAYSFIAWLRIRLYFSK